MTVPESLPQRVHLLAYDPAKGRVGVDTNLGLMLRAAALTDLFRSGHLADAHGRAAVALRRPRRDPVLDALLDEIAGSGPRTWRFWVERGYRAARGAVRQQLAERGWVHLRPGRALGLFPTTRMTLRDPRARTELLGRVDAALRRPVRNVDPADAALVAVVAAGDLCLVLDRRTRRTHAPRIREFTALSGPACVALRGAVQEAAAVG